MGQPGNEGIKLATFATLRALADMFSVARSCVNKRVQEVVGLEWDIVPTDEAEHAMRGDDAKRGEWEKRRAVVHEFFEHPDSDRGKYPTWGVWLSALLEDLFVLDAVALHLRPTRGRSGGPFNAGLASLDLLDGSTIRPQLDVYGATPKPPAVAYQQYIWGVPRVDLTSVMMGTDVDDITDQMVAEYRADQLMYLRFRPRNWTPYGFGPVEEALLPIMIGLARQQYQWDYFQDGSIPGQFVTPGPEVATPQQIRQLQDALNAMAGDVAAKHRIIVLPPGSKTDPQKPPPLADQFDEWIISQVAMPFGLTPMDLGVTPRVSAVQSLSESKQISQVNSTEGHSTRVEPVTAWLKQVLFDYVIQGVFGQDDMQFSWGVTEDGDDEDTAVQLHVTQVQNALESIDEARVDMGHTPWGLPETSVPLVFTPTGPIPIAAAAQQAQAGADQAQAMADMARDGKVPPPPGQRGKDEGPKDERGEPTTPAHEAAEDLPESRRRKPSGDGKAEKALAAELQILSRHLRKGRPPEAFHSEVIPAEILAGMDVSKGVPEAVAAVGYAARRALAIGGTVVAVAKQLGRIAYAFRTGKISFPAAVDGAVAEMREGYHAAMAAGSEHAAADHQVSIVHFGAEVSGRAQQQRGFVSKMLSKTPDVADIGPRLDLYGSTLHGAYNEAYGKTIEADGDHDYDIVWRLGHTEHCVKCVARAGRSFTFDDLPGWPGDGGFGELCEGGPNCGCHLEFIQRRQPVSVGVNTQRPDSVAYYAEQNARISAARREADERRDRFLGSIPGGAAARAAYRDATRVRLAEFANAYIRARGGYQGVSVEPEDISADLVAAHVAAGVDPVLVKLEVVQMCATPEDAAHLVGTLYDEAEYAAVGPLVVIKWDPGKHPRGPDGRFINIGALVGGLEHPGHESPGHREHIPPLGEVGQHMDALMSDLLLDGQGVEPGARGRLSPEERQASLHVIADAATRSHAYTDEQVNHAMRHINLMEARMHEEKQHAARMKLAVGIASIIAGLLLGIFAGPVIGVVGVVVGEELAKELPKLLTEVSKELGSFHIERPGRFREQGRQLGIFGGHVRHHGGVT